MDDGKIYVDFEEGIKRTKLYVMQLRKAREQCNPRKLGEFLAAGNRDKAKDEASTIRRTSAKLFLLELFKRALDMEMEIDSGNLSSDLFEKVQSVYDLTVKEIDRVIAEYKRQKV